MVMEAYDGKPIPERLWTGDILNAFCEAKIFGRTDEERERFAPRSQLVTELVRLMRKLKRDNFLRDELHDFSAEWSKALLERELTRSPYLQLLDEGVLMETPIAEEWGRFRRIVGYQVRFAFEPLFKFLLSNELLAEGGGWKGLTGKKVARWLSEGGDFDHLTGAVMILLTEAVQEGNLSLVAETLNAADIKLAEPVIIEVLTTLEGLKDERFEPLLDELAEKAESEKALTVLINASYQFGIKQRHRPALACTERAERLAKHLVEVEGGVELANDLARALVNKGNALSYLGHPKEAIDCYDEAIEIRRRLVEVEGGVELANDLASALMNKGNALSYLGHPKEAIDCYEEAIGIYRRLVEVEGRVELENDLAGALMNKGVALSDLGRLSEALQCYDEGIGLWEMMMAEGKIHVAPLLIKGLGNRFELKQQMGDWEGAADDVRKVLACVMPFLSSDSLTEALAMEFGSFLWRLRQLTEEEWTALASALGEYAELVRQLMQL
jgi:tetratricopeptide (TPR) repeat protein